MQVAPAEVGAAQDVEAGTAKSAENAEASTEKTEASPEAQPAQPAQNVHTIQMVPPVVSEPTAVMVDRQVEVRNKSLRAPIAQSLMGLITIAMDVVGMTRDKDTCDASPVSWSLWYMLHAVIIGVHILVLLATVYLLTMIFNRTTMQANVHAGKGKIVEAIGEATRGQAETQRGQALLIRLGVFSILIICWALVWVIIGIVAYVNSEDDSCTDAKNWLWVIFATNFCLSAIGQALRHKPQQD